MSTEDKIDAPKRPASDVPLTWPAPIVSYDVHTYFQHEDPASVESAEQLRNALIKEFGGFEDFRVFKMHKRPMGPHLIGMFECDFRDPFLFARIVPWMQLHHGQHSVLVHPHTGNALKDHTEHAIWIGEKQPLLLDILENH